eukprot:scaffold471720_cov39-Prasinocladus_malaysianus.AAC.1
MQEKAPVARGPSDPYKHKTVMLEPEGLQRPGAKGVGADSNKDAASALRAQLAGTKRGAAEE